MKEEENGDGAGEGGGTPLSSSPQHAHVPNIIFVEIILDGRVISIWISIIT